jgi:hypothetical protein
MPNGSGALPDSPRCSVANEANTPVRFAPTELSVHFNMAASVALATDPEVPGSIPGATRFSEKQLVFKDDHLAS